MVEIKVDGKRLDLFPDTKVLGNFSNDFENGVAFELPYTNTFSIPLTTKNAYVLDYDKNTMSFSLDEKTAVVYVDGAVMFSGVIVIDEAISYTLNETININIIDEVKRFLDNAKNKKLEDFVTDKYRYFYIDKIHTVNNEEFFCGWYDQYQYKDNTFIDAENRMKPLYTNSLDGNNNYLVSYPILSVVKNIFENNGISFNANLGIDLADSMSVIVPTKYVSCKTTDSLSFRLTNSDFKSFFIPGSNLLDKIQKGEADKEISDQYKKINNQILSKTVNIYSGNNTDSFFSSPQAFNYGKCLASRNIIVTATPTVEFNNTLNPNMSFGKLTCKHTDGKYYDFELGEVKGDQLYLFLTAITPDDNEMILGKVGEFDYGLKGFRATDDLLYGSSIKLNAGEMYRLALKLVSTGETTILNKNVNTHPLKTAANLVISATNGIYVNQFGFANIADNYFTLNFNYDLFINSMNISIKYEKTEIGQNEFVYEYSEKILNSVDGTSSTEMSADKPHQVDIKSTLKYCDITLYDFITDFCNRFNKRLSIKNGTASFIQRTNISNTMEGSYIDISNRIDSSISNTKENSLIEDSSVIFNIKNKAGDFYMDKFADGNSYGSYVEDKKSSGDTEKTISLKSSILPPLPTKKRKESQSEGVTSIANKISTPQMIGLSDYESATVDDMGIRYCYKYGQTNVFGMSPTFIDNLPQFEPVPFISRLYIPSGSPVFGVTQGDVELWENVNKGFIGSGYTVINKKGCVFLKTQGTTLSGEIQAGILDTFEEYGDFVNVGDSTVSRLLKTDYTKTKSTVTTNGETSYSSLEFYYDGNSIPMFRMADSSETFKPNSIYAIPLVAKNSTSVTDRLYPQEWVKEATTSIAVLYSDYATIIPNLTNSIPYNGKTLTLSYSPKGVISSGREIVTMFDLSYKDYRDLVVKKSKNRISISVYLDAYEAYQIMNSCGITLFGKKYYVEKASDLAFNSFGGICKLTIVEI